MAAPFGLCDPYRPPLRVCRDIAALVFKAQLFTRDKRSRPIQGGIFRLEYDRLRYAPTPRREGIESPVASRPVRSRKAAVQRRLAQVHEVIRPKRRGTLKRLLSRVPLPLQHVRRHRRSRSRPYSWPASSERDGPIACRKTTQPDVGGGVAAARIAADEYLILLEPAVVGLLAAMRATAR
jgi:hypothetical protein